MELVIRRNNRAGLQQLVPEAVDLPCGCRKLRRGWSGGISVLVDESATAGRFHDLEVSIWLVCGVGGDGWSLVERTVVWVPETRPWSLTCRYADRC